MTSKKLVSIILPTLNERESVVVVITRLQKIFHRLKSYYKFEIIIVDDDSKDGIEEIIKEKYSKKKNIKLFIRKNERGLGTAIGFGIKKATGDIILGVDADGNHELEKIPSLLDNLKKYDLVVGSRFIKNGGAESTLDKFRHLASFSVNLFLKIIGFPVWDSTSGFYAINKNKLFALGIDKIYYGYGDYHLRLVYFAKVKKYTIKETPYIYKKRIAGNSKSELFNMFFDYLREGLRLRFFNKR